MEDLIFTILIEIIVNSIIGLFAFFFGYFAYASFGVRDKVEGCMGIFGSIILILILVAFNLWYF
jgi:hypothetical protein